MDTKFLINNDSITKMKYGVMIINTGRGKLIKTEDLINGLRSHQVGSAALDVYEEDATHNIAVTTFQNIRDFLDGKELANEVK